VDSVASGKVWSTRGRIAFIIVFMIVLFVGAYLSSQIYGNSAEGIATLAGELFGVASVLGLLTWSLRRATYTAAVVLAVAALSVGLSNIGKLQESIAAHEGKAALQGISGPTQIDRALSQNPSNTFLQLMAMASKASEETGVLTTKLSNEIEPPALATDINYATASRNDLEAYRAT
jgi:hypothetical protein